MTSEDLKKPVAEPEEPQTTAPRPDGELDSEQLDKIAAGGDAVIGLIAPRR